MEPAITQYLQALLTRAGEVIDPPAELSIIAPGAEVAWDNCCGQLWVRLVGYGSAQQRGQTRRKADGTMCTLRRMATVEIGILRCAAVVDDNGNPPTEAELNEDGRQVLSDAEALWIMLECEVALSGEPTWTPQGPEGACVGGVWQFPVEMT